MIIKEIPNYNINLSLPKFQCDYKLVQDKDISPLPNSHFFYCFIGRAGSGKTSIATSLITSRGKKRIYRKIFDNIVIIMPKNSLNSLADNHAFKSHNEDKVFHELDVETLIMIEEMIKDYAENEENSLIFIDDFASSLKNKEVQKMLNNIVNNRRHLRCSIMLISQYLNSIPLTIRRNISNINIWKPVNKREGQIVYEELIQMDKDKYEKIVDYVYKKPHDFLYIDLINNQMYRNYNKLVFEKDEDKESSDIEK